MTNGSLSLPRGCRLTQNPSPTFRPHPSAQLCVTKALSNITKGGQGNKDRAIPHPSARCAFESTMERTIVYRTDPVKENVQIAGSFTQWTPESLIWNGSKKQFEYEVALTDESGKLEFKFIVDGEWVVDQNYASGEWRAAGSWDDY